MELKIRKFITNEHKKSQDINLRENFIVHIHGVEHSITVRDTWQNCGETGELIECSCGFCDYRSDGNGCWQHSHNVKSDYNHQKNIHHQIISDFYDLGDEFNKSFDFSKKESNEYEDVFVAKQ